LQRNFFCCGSLLKNPVAAMLKRIIADEIQTVWTKYVTFAIYIVGISGGVHKETLRKLFIRTTLELVLIKD